MFEEINQNFLEIVYFGNKVCMEFTEEYADGNLNDDVIFAKRIEEVCCHITQLEMMWE